MYYEIQVNGKLSYSMDLTLIVFLILQVCLIVYLLWDLKKWREDLSQSRYQDIDDSFRPKKINH